jgi:ribosomal protein L11 methyltransferase
MSGGYLRIRFELGAEREDELVADLWAQGCLGTETRDLPDGGVVVEAWFPPETGFGGSESESVWARELARERIPPRDWMADYRARAQPTVVGRRLIIDPREPEVAGRAGSGGSRTLESSGERQLLRIPAREAFGTGSHASTRLALEMLEDLDPSGLRVLDVGAGSGILSFAAELFGAGFVAGVELDLVSAFMAGQNRGLNQLAPSFVAGTLDALVSSGSDAGGRVGPGFDLALVNVLPFRIRPYLPRIADLLAPGAVAVFSGIPRDEGARLLVELADLGLVLQARRSEEEWVAFMVVKRSPPDGDEAAAG